MLRPILAYAAAAALACALGAALTIALVALYGFWEWPFLGWVWLWLSVIGFFVALAGGGPIAALATVAARFARPPRPAADMLLAALGAAALLLAFRTMIFNAFGGAEIGFLPAGFGPILAVPALAGAAFGWLYWRLAGRPKPPAREPD